MLRSFLPHKILLIQRSNAGLGLFATHDIRKWQKIIEYTWQKVATSVADRIWGKYLFTVNSRYTIIGTWHHNRARYINHSCAPNCQPLEVRWRIIISAIKPIKAGEELVYNYGKDYFERIIKPMWCRCVKCSKK
jgi:uncharacterized protein